MYENLSKQAINFRKSSVFFNPNTTTTNRMQVCGVLQVNEVDILGNYLGFPMHIGRRKNYAFKFLIDRVSQKLQGWELNHYEKGEACTFETTTQTIPNFWMNLFLIPNEVRYEIQRQMNSFW